MHDIHEKDKVWIFDTTLRDGEQALQASLSVKQKLQLAHAIARLNVDVMEVGFPVSSPGDFTSVKQIAEQVKGPVICGLARAVDADIDACGEALKNAERQRIHTFIATSPVHLEHKLRISLDAACERAVASIRRASKYTDDIEFSCEDAGRTPIDDLCWIIEKAIAAGATTINIPDTVGYTIPAEFARIITELRNRVPNIDKARLSVHCHNDLGLAVANSIQAVQAGARQVEGTVNGIGERAGNCALEEIAMILRTRQDVLPYTTDIKSKEIYRTSHLVSQICNMPVQANKAIVGSNAFAHSSGIHQDGILKAQHTYEILSPESIGLRQNEMNMTSRSGRHVIQHRLQSMGYEAQDYDIDSIYSKFLTLADHKGRVYDYDLEALVFADNLKEQDEKYGLQSLSTSTHSEFLSSATVSLQCDGQIHTEAGTGNGPVEAAFQAIRRISELDIEMLDYNLAAKGSGENALGQVDITAQYQGKRYHGSGLATDIVRASVLAFVHVHNMIARAEQVGRYKQEKQEATGAQA